MFVSLSVTTTAVTCVTSDVLPPLVSFNHSLEVFVALHETQGVCGVVCGFICVPICVVRWFVMFLATEEWIWLVQLLLVKWGLFTALF